MNGARVPVLAIFGLSAAIAAVPAAAAHANYFLHPALYAQFFSIGDVFPVCFYAVLSSAPGRGTDVEALL
jgi:hypothetical protein